MRLELSWVALSVLFLSSCIVHVDTHTAVLCADGDACGGGEYCDYPQGDACGHDGSLGVCTARPQACPEYASPVCGCDGVTYANPCLARAAGVDVARSGACDDTCVADDAHAVGLCRVFLGYYWDGESCVGLSGCYCVGVDCVDGFSDRSACETAHRSCATHACSTARACSGSEWCDFDDSEQCGQSDAEGVCRARLTACPPVIYPVCGCSGVTFASACDANGAGTDVAYDGACESDEVCGGIAGFVCDADEWCDYPSDAMCGIADQTGTCRPRPDGCTLLYAPVCGCDGRTYSNECAANAEGIDAAYQGECSTGDRCGEGRPCGAAEWCDVTDGAACSADGICRPRPMYCPDYWSPVCGCDGVTYGNDCDAHGGGTDIAYAGECGAPCALISELPRACSTDSDCMIADHQVNCCGTHVMTGLSSSARGELERLEPLCRSSYPGCGCPTGPTTTDSGETVTAPTEVRVGCISRGPAGACMSYIHHRPPDGL